jgi:hypothetical protein
MMEGVRRRTDTFFRPPANVKGRDLAHEGT